MKKTVELLAPAGTYDKMETAFYFGADAVYFAGKQFGLRAFAGNFENEEIERATAFAHSLSKKVYVTINIIAHDSDFVGLEEYAKFLEKTGVDGVIVADIGVMRAVTRYAPKLPIHISTQANVINSESAKLFADLGAKRIVLARELSLEEISKIRKNLPKEVELETFVHGAMCISYSGRCLLSNYLSGRDSNRGACVQACRWEYTITERSRKGQEYPIEEDDKGTYILNSKDLCMVEHLESLKKAGVYSFKIEGRMKSPYYVAGVVNTYRRAIGAMENGKKLDFDMVSELEKTSHRKFTTGFYEGANDKECLSSSYPVQTFEFMAVALEDTKNGKVKIEQRNRFKVGDVLEVLSPTANFNKTIEVQKMENEVGEEIVDALRVQEKLYLYTTLNLCKGDILRKKQESQSEK